MRTTLDVADDVLASVKEMARREKRSAGDVLSDLARRGLTLAGTSPAAATVAPAELHGFRPFASRGAVVTDELIRRLRDESAC